MGSSIRSPLLLSSFLSQRTKRNMSFFTPMLIYYLECAVLLFAIVTSVQGGKSVDEKYLQNCEKTSELSSSSPSDISLSCHLRTINSEFDKTNFSAIPGDSVVSLRLECSNILFYQSSLESASLSHLTRLSSLHIEHCKLSRLPPGVFSGLDLLRNLTIRTHNTAWPALSLDIAAGVFNQLPHLEKIDVSANNIWTFPDRVFCGAVSLEHLNVSMNRLQDISNLSFRERDDDKDSGSSGSNGFMSSGCNMGIKSLDVSSNRLILLPSQGLARLGQLRELYLQRNELSVVADQALARLKQLRIFNLADNKVSALPAHLFQDTPEISEIYLQNNSLSSLPARMFAKLDQLVVLDLSHNGLTSKWIIGGSGSSVVISQEANSSIGDTRISGIESSNDDNGEAEVDPQVFSGLIRLVLLNMSYNKLTHLSPHAFKDLYSLQILNLEHNEISSVGPNTFSAMNNLHTLILSHNKLTFIDSTALNGLFVLSLLSLDNNEISSIHAAAFHNCSSLQDLNLNGNAFTESPTALQNLTLLKTVDLGENNIEQLESPRLIGLPNLYGLRVTGNRVVNISKKALEELASLKVLNLARNQIQSVEPGAFDTNTNLQAVRLDANYLTDISNLFADSPNLIFLNISDNHLTWFDYALIPPQLQWLDIHKNGVTELSNYYQRNDLRLQTLDASFNRITRLASANIPDSMENLFLNDNLVGHVEPHTFYKKSNLSRVDIFANQIESMDLSALRLSPFPDDRPLPEFYMGGNPIICDCNMEWLQRINKLDHLRQHPKVMDLDSIYCKLLYNRDKYYVPLTEADPSQFLCSYNTHCFTLCHCCDFDACDCEMTCPQNCTCYHDDTWSANIVDCANREHVSIPARIPMDSTEVYLDGNRFTELTSHVFIGRKNLRVLYLNHSAIERIQNNSFSGLKRLSVLHLENNFITELQGYEFEPLESLRELYLQSNFITYISNYTFTSLRMLEVLKLDGNQLSRYTMWTLSQNPYLVDIGLTDNPWSCECEYVSQAAPWVQSNVAKLMDAAGVNCRLNGQSLSLVYMNGTKCSEITALSGAVEAPETSLPPYLPLLAAVMALCLVMGSLFVAMCRKRNSLRIWAVSKCPLSPCYKTGLDEEREKLYDAYVAYSVNDEPWVSQVLAAELQQQCDQPYRLCLHYKDFPVTSYVSDTIVEAVESSKRTVIVLSKNFVQSEWCRFEFKSALHAALRGKKNKLVAVTLGDLPTRDLDPDLRVCLRSATVLSTNDKLFWAKLKCALPDPRKVSTYSSRHTLGRPSSGLNNYSCASSGASTLPLNFSANMTLPNNHHNGNVNHQHQLSGSNTNTLVNTANTMMNGHHHHHHHLDPHNLSHHNNGTNTLGGNSGSVPLYVPPFPPPNRPPPPFPAPRRPPPPTPLWA